MTALVVHAVRVQDVAEAKEFSGREVTPSMMNPFPMNLAAQLGAQSSMPFVKPRSMHQWSAISILADEEALSVLYRCRRATRYTPSAEMRLTRFKRRKDAVRTPVWSSTRSD